MLTSMERLLELKKVNAENVCKIVEMYNIDLREDIVFGRVIRNVIYTYRVNNTFSTFLHPKDVTDFKVIVRLGDLVHVEDMWYFKAVINKTFKDEEVVKAIKEKFNIKELELKDVSIRDNDLVVDVHCKLLSKRLNIRLDQENRIVRTPVEIVFNSIIGKIGLAKYMDKKVEKDVEHLIDMVYFNGYESMKLEVSEYKRHLEYIKDIFESEGFQLFDFKSIKISDIEIIDDKLHFNIKYVLKNMIAEYPKEILTRKISE